MSSENRRYGAQIKTALRMAREDRPDLVPFLGAGTSVPLGLPTWDELLKQLAAGLPPIENLAGMAPPRVLQRIRDQLQPTEFIRRVQLALQSPPHGTSLALYALAQTDVSRIVTTNLDLVAESAFASAGYPISHHNVFRGPCAEELAAFDGTSSATRIFKIHGSLERPSTWVLTQEEYDRAYVDPGPLKSFLASKIRIPFFIGFGFSDFDVEESLRIARLRERRAYSLVPIQEAPRLDDKLRSRGVIPIYFYTFDQIPEVIDEVFGTRAVEISRTERLEPDTRAFLQIGWARVPLDELQGAEEQSHLIEILANAVEPRPNRSVLDEKDRRAHGPKRSFAQQIESLLEKDSFRNRTVVREACKALGGCPEILTEQLLPVLLRSERTNPYDFLMLLFEAVEADRSLSRRIEECLRRSLEDMGLSYGAQRALTKVLGARGAHLAQTLPPVTARRGHLRISKYLLTRYQVGSLTGNKALREKDPLRPYTLSSTAEASQILSRLSEEDGREWRLPNEREWLAFAGVDRQPWPWGSHPPQRGVHAHLTFLLEGGGIVNQPLEVGVFPKGRSTKLGLYDLIGNVYELVTRPQGGYALAGGGWTTNFKSSSDFRMIREFRSGRGNVGLRPVCGAKHRPK